MVIIWLYKKITVVEFISVSGKILIPQQKYLLRLFVEKFIMQHLLYDFLKEMLLLKILLIQLECFFVLRSLTNFLCKVILRVLVGCEIYLMSSFRIWKSTTVITLLTKQERRETVCGKQNNDPEKGSYQCVNNLFCVNKGLFTWDFLTKMDVLKWAETIYS